ncbi:MAG: DUF1573 domain-containing protein [candidate division Zixibacteria bacterium]|nr:DUF1573 domain-containing protein [candidate division Zixibacteria bacterium]MDH3938432.1 DUF1573 domain-containing protein [candidate division Zixibacteria bacterium]
MYKYATSILLALLLLAIGTTPSSAAPKLSIAEKSFDFGFSPQNAKLSHVFWLKAEGTDSLKILKVVPGCGCTKAPLERNHLAVGDSTRLEIVFSTGKRSGPASKSPSIKTNAGGPDQRVRFVTNIVTRPDSTYPIIISPYKLTLGQFTAKQRNELSFTIENVSPGDLTFRLVDLPQDYFDVSLPTTIASQSTAECSLVLTEVGLTGSFEKSFTIELDDDERSRFTVPVKHQAAGIGKQVSSMAAPE